MTSRQSTNRQDFSAIQTSGQVDSQYRQNASQVPVPVHPCELPFNVWVSNVVSDDAMAGRPAGAMPGGFASLITPDRDEPNGLPDLNMVFGNSSDDWFKSPMAEQGPHLYGVRVGPWRTGATPSDTVKGVFGAADYQGVRTLFTKPQTVPFVPMKWLGADYLGASAVGDTMRLRLMLSIHYFEFDSGQTAESWHALKNIDANWYDDTRGAVVGESGETMGWSSVKSGDTLKAVLNEFVWEPVNGTGADSGTQVTTYESLQTYEYGVMGWTTKSAAKYYGEASGVNSATKFHVVQFPLAMLEMGRPSSGLSESQAAAQYAASQPRVVDMVNDSVLTVGGMAPASVGDNVLMKITRQDAPFVDSAPFKYKAMIYREQYTKDGVTASPIVSTEQDLWLSEKALLPASISPGGSTEGTEADLWYFGQRRLNHWEGIKKKR